MKITFISDTHAKHHYFTPFINGGDVIVHAGDIMTSGYETEQIYDFLSWFSNLDYEHKIFIAGNHDRLFETQPNNIVNIMTQYMGVTYLQDKGVKIGKYNFYGSPWQPTFYNWAFNLPRSGQKLEDKWAKIPEKTDILITHGPPQTILDTSGPPYNDPNLGCELLYNHVNGRVKPLIHVFGHIHGSYGERLHNGVQYINASCLDESYNPVNRPIDIEIKDGNVIFI